MRSQDYERNAQPNASSATAVAASDHVSAQRQAMIERSRQAFIYRITFDSMGQSTETSPHAQPNASSATAVAASDHVSVRVKGASWVAGLLEDAGNLADRYGGFGR